MLHTTFNLAHKSNACALSYKKLAEYLGGVGHYGKDTPIPLTTVLESNGLDDTIWALRCTIEPSKNILIEFTCRCAEHVLHFYEDKYPEDTRPRQAIEAARRCMTDKSFATEAATEAAAWAARTATEAAAWAARSAARSAAEAAWAATEAAAWAARTATEAARSAAEAAARSAAEAARSAAEAARSAAEAAWAARSAAEAAAWAAEKQWQTQQLIELLAGK